MDWMSSIGDVVAYIEGHITEEISVETLAAQVHISPFYLQKGFSLLCGFTLAEYIRKRRLALAGSELASTDEKVIDVAIKYGYDAPDSFSKAFTRFHGITPAAARKGGATLKAFAPLKLTLTLEGGYLMDYKIVEKDSFTVIGVSKTCQYANAQTEIPALWATCMASSQGRQLCGKYGVNYDENMAGQVFEYLIGDDYSSGMKVPAGFVTKVIPAFTWAVFPCKGAMPEVMQETNRKIFSEWLPTCQEYEIAAGYCIEQYDDPEQYPGGTGDENYSSELWVPIKKTK